MTIVVKMLFHNCVFSPHRVNGVLRNSVDFAEAFQCSDNKYMNPMDKFKIFG